MLIGITSQNFRTITGHAGKARRFIIYEADAASGEIKEIERLDLPPEMSIHSFTGTQHSIDQVDLLITGSCGGGFLKRMASHGVQVLTTCETDPIKAIQTILRGEPLPTAEAHSHQHTISTVKLSTIV